MNAIRLQRIISNREHKKAQNYLLELFAKLSPSQRLAIKRDMEKIKDERKSRTKNKE